MGNGEPAEIGCAVASGRRYDAGMTAKEDTKAALASVADTLLAMTEAADGEQWGEVASLVERVAQEFATLERALMQLDEVIGNVDGLGLRAAAIRDEIEVLTAHMRALAVRARRPATEGQGRPS